MPDDTPQPHPAPAAIQAQGAAPAPAGPRVLAATAAVGLAASMLLSRPTWTLDRELPVVPLVPGLPLATPAWSAALSWAVVGLAAMTPALLLTRWRPLAAACPLGAVLVGAWLALHDALRLQPWFVLYMLVLSLVAAAAIGGPGSAASLRRATALLLAGAYVYSGLHKFSHTFVHDTFPELVRPLAAAVHAPEWLVAALAWAVPPGEVLIGAMLLLPRARAAGVIAAGAMHAGILLALGPLGRNENAVVWPWNLAMLGMLTLVCWPSGPFAAAWPAQQPHDRPHGWPRGGHAVFWLAAAPALIAGCVLPALGLFGRWPLYLSWALYAGREPQVSLGFTDSAFDALPASLKAHRRPVDAAPIIHAVVLSDWISAQSAARPFPELWYTRAVAVAVLTDLSRRRPGQGLEGVLVVTSERPDLLTGQRREATVRAERYLAEP